MTHGTRTELACLRSAERDLMAAVGGVVGGDAKVTVQGYRTWASLSFSGSRIDCSVVDGREGWPADIRAIWDMDFPDLIVADVEVTGSDVSLLTVNK